jgi:hypothetical protein
MKMPQSIPANWTDMSNYIVHFTKKGPQKSEVEAMFSIYTQRKLKARSSFGIGRKAPSAVSQKTVCLSEIPAGKWRRIVEQRESSYGMGFSKDFIVGKGGGPIWYAWRGTPHWRALQAQMAVAAKDPASPIWRLTPMIDAPGQHGKRRYEFDWEREWRVVGDLNFRTEDVAFLFLPESRHQEAEAFFEGVARENVGPSYNCPFIDPLWTRKQVNQAIRTFKKRDWRTG